MPPRFLRNSALAVVCALAIPAAIAARQVSFDTAVADLRAGDPLRGLASLNELLKQSPQSPQLAMIHAYRALAYARMEQRDRARAAAAQALQADPKLTLGPPDFTPDVISLFEGLRTYTPADLAVAAEPPKPPPPAPKPPAASAPTTAAVSSAAAEVYVYWPPQVRGGGRPKVYCDGARVADLNDQHYIKLRAPAGTHNLKFHNKEMPIGLDAGKTYYLRASAEGFPVHAVLRQVDENEATTEMKEKNIELNDPKKTYSTECAAPRSKKK